MKDTDLGVLAVSCCFLFAWRCICLHLQVQSSKHLMHRFSSNNRWEGDREQRKSVYLSINR